MTLKTDLILNLPAYNETKAAKPIVSNTGITLYNSAVPENIDTFESENPKSEEKSSKIGEKILKGVGITVGVFAFLAAFKAVGRNRYTAKHIASLSDELKNNGLGEFAKLTDFKTFSNVKMFSNLRKHEKKRMYNYFIFEPDAFFATLMGKKPAFYRMIGHSRIGCLRKINPDKIDTINAKTIVLNKPEVMKLIEKYRKIYTSRLGLDPNAKTEEIYSKLKKDLAHGSICDLLGLTLGFPKYDSMIFKLEQVKSTCRLREYPAEFKKEILEALRSEESPYKSLDETELKNLENAIKNITKVDAFNVNMWGFVNFTNDTEELGRIAKADSEFIKGFKVQDLL